MFSPNKLLDCYSHHLCKLFPPTNEKYHKLDYETEIPLQKHLTIDFGNNQGDDMRESVNVVNSVLFIESIEFPNINQNGLHFHFDDSSFILLSINSH